METSSLPVPGMDKKGSLFFGEVELMETFPDLVLFENDDYVVSFFFGEVELMETNKARSRPHTHSQSLFFGEVELMETLVPGIGDRNTATVTFLRRSGINGNLFFTLDILNHYPA